MSISGWYYLHTNGELIYKRDLDGTAADIRESDFARALWPMDPTDRESAWTILVEALALGANEERIAELEAALQRRTVSCVCGGEKSNKEYDRAMSEGYEAKLRALTTWPGDEKVLEAVGPDDVDGEASKNDGTCFSSWSHIAVRHAAKRLWEDRKTLASALRAKQEELEAVSLDHNYGQCAFRKHAEAAEKALAAAQERIKTLEGR